MLDTSPSCKRVASFYGLIAQLAAKYDDIEMYDAPNGYAHSIYDKRIKKFRELNTDEITPIEALRILNDIKTKYNI